MTNQKPFNIFFSVLIFLFSLTSIATPLVIGDISISQNINIPQHIPGNVKKVPELLISRPEYLISFNQKTRLLNWAAWKLDASDIGHIGRSNNFQVDPELQTYLDQFHQAAVTAEDYRGTCFDRGHQVPSADRDTTVALNSLTFLMSNMIPQTAYLNRVRWEHLEEYTRTLVTVENKKLYILAGPIYDEDFGAIGPNLDIPVPSKNFKVIIVLEQNQTLKDITKQTRIISVVMPNRLMNGKKPLDDKQALCDEAGHVGNPTTTPEASDVGTDPKAPAAPHARIPLTAEELVDWMPYQVPLSDVEKLSGFSIAPQTTSKH